MMTTDAYKNTEVPFYKSFVDIEKLLAKYGMRGTCVHMAEDRTTRQPGAIVVLLERKLRKDGPVLPYRMRLNYQYARGVRDSNAGTSADQMARMMFYRLKSKLEVVASGVPFEEEFLAYQLVTEEQTIFETLEPRLGQLQHAELPSIFPRALGYNGR
jgi:hypothetical protein